MTAHRTAGQLRALRELCALARTGLDVADAIAAAGQESDDRPRQWLTSLERWARGEETPAQLAAATRAVEEWRWPKGVTDGTLHAGALAYWCGAIGLLIDARADMTKHPTHIFHSARVTKHLAVAVAACAGESDEAAQYRVKVMLGAHADAIGEESARAEVAARLRQAKADKVVAERALGTLPGME